MRNFSVSVLIPAALIVAFSAASPTLCSAQAQIFRVGPNGEYADVSAALGDLLAAPQINNWIKVQAGVTTNENVVFPSSWVDGTIWLSGGWDSSFTSQSGDPADTIIGGGLTNSVIRISMSGGTITISDLSIVDGSSGAGGGFQINPANTCAIRLENLAIHDNVSVSTGSAAGGAINASLQHTNSLDIVDCDIHTNVASGGSGADGAAINIYSEGVAEFSITDSAIHDNTADSDNQVGGAGLKLNLGQTATGLVADCIVENNTATSVIPITVDGVGLMAVTNSSAQLVIERTRFVGNTVSTASDHEQVAIMAFGDSIVWISDSVIAEGVSDGLYLRADDQSLIHATNLTVTLNDNDGVVCNRVPSATATIDVSNTIAYLNAGLDLNISSGPVAQVGNLVNVDPEFVDAQNLDFRFEIGSAAEDSGAASPPGGLGTGDIRGGIRVLGSAPDIGAYEGNVSLLFSDGFDLKGTRRWSSVVGGLIN